MTRTRTLTLLFAATLAGTTLSTALRADEVVLKDGRVVVGSTKKVGTSLEVTTLDGVVRVAVADVDWQRTRNDEQLRQALELLAMRSGAGSCHAQLELARVARSWGLHDEMWSYLGKVLRTQGRSRVMARRTREFMAELENVVLPKKWRDRDTEVKVRELLYRLKQKPVPPAKAAAISELLARLPESDAFLKRRARGLANTLQRSAAVKALALRSTEGNDRFVYRTAILDRSPEVRRDALQVSQDLGRTKAAIEYIAPLLLHDNASFRIRAAEAFAELRDPAAVPLLVAAGPTAGTMRRAVGGGATRAHMAVIQQVAYVRDFDVEVAQASFIADPKIDVLHSGMVLDVTVIAVTTHRTEVVNAYRDAIRRIVNVDPGSDPKKWAEWLKGRGDLARAELRPETGPARKR